MLRKPRRVKVIEQSASIEARLIRRRTDNPNKMEPERFDLLVNAIKHEGFLQPVLVRPIVDEDYRYEMIDGHHRLDAVESLGQATILAVVAEATDAEALALQVGLNKLRGELDLMLCASQLQQLVADFSWSADELTLTGFAAEECRAMLELATVAGDPEADLLSQPLELPDGKRKGGRPVFELEFASREEMLETRKALRKVNPDLGRAVRYLLGLEEEEDASC